ncbi:MAG: M48 family metallopeptidase [Gammaproteobacteria bacterium]|nr:M48 family metallopeptidase [Rhodocyclaceae bacterium]MBU3909384.1 M48 family metallopeptidase [Gammaproteobacteria bacterium]MBU3990205.1 M48 family metallopeptidase [Gammaproteobacteria bacterium]MBU4020991.1 M48 family metallopeptidase [Gammaproteobacteria bacterium]MBU4096810.1 M48 family metallopeptidase [Gammaproteobacteria bacterium]
MTLPHARKSGSLPPRGALAGLGLPGTGKVPQLTLRLEAAAPDGDAPWRAGGSVVFLGASLRLVLDTACRTPERIGEELHLPLPPAATPRQIRDAAESWLRDEASRSFTAIVTQKSALAGRRSPDIALVFGKRSDWVQRDGDKLRCHWRLIEQLPTVIEQVLGRALAAMQPAPVCDDLFAVA